MKIVEVRAVPLCIPAPEGAPPSPWTAEMGRQVLVRLTTDDGLVGWGECFAYGAPRAVCSVVDEELAPLLLDKDTALMEDLLQEVHRRLMTWGRRGLGMFAVSGVELALWDLKGKSLGMPVVDLLGGTRRSRVPAYASLPHYATPEDVERAVKAAVARGYRAIKLHQTDMESIAAARRAVGNGVDLMLDVNCAWSAEEAIRAIRRLECFDLRWVEEPLWPPEDHAGLSRIRARVGIPIACGENESTVVGLGELVAKGAVDFVQPSVTKMGGLLEMKKILRLASEAAVAIAPHSYYFGPGLAATLHFIASMPGDARIEMPFAELEAPILAEPVQCVKGFVDVIARPGLGADPNLDAVARYGCRISGAPREPEGSGFRAIRGG